VNSRDSFDAYQLYLGIKLHFYTDSYNFIQYNGKVKPDLKSFLKRNDRFQFGKLARKYNRDLQDFYIANLSFKDYWVGDLLEPDAHKRYTEWKKRNQKLKYMFETEVGKILEKKKIQEVLKVENGNHPWLLKQYLANNISIETMSILDSITNYSTDWRKLISETIIYPDIQNKIDKYKVFLSYDYDEFKKLLIKLCSQ